MPDSLVYLLDDEPGMVKALTRLLRIGGFNVEGFTSAAGLMEAFQPQRKTCLVLDVAMPGLDGIHFQEQLTRQNILLPIVFLTGHGDIPMSVRAMKAGAVDFLTKPVNGEDLFDAVRTALKVAGQRRAERAEGASLADRFNLLTPREREVMAHVVAGQLNKQIAADLGTGEQNIKIHRGRIMEKMGVHSVAELVRAAGRLGF